MKKLVNFTLIVLIIISSITVVYAENSIITDLDNTYYTDVVEQTEYILTIIERNQEGYGVGNVDLENVYLGNEIPLYECTENGISRIDKKFYPLMDNESDIVALIMSFVDETGIVRVEFTTELVNEIKSIGEINKIAFVYDQDGLNIVSNLGVSKIYDNDEYMDVTRSDFDSAMIVSNALSTSNSIKLESYERQTKLVKNDGTEFRNGSYRTYYVPRYQQASGSSYCWACCFISLGRFFFSGSQYNYDPETEAIEITGNINTSQTMGQIREHLYDYFPMAANGHTYSVKTGLTYLTLVTEIESGYPFIGRIENGPGHVVVICGYDNTNGNYYTMMDPAASYYRTGTTSADRPVWTSPSTGSTYAYTSILSH